MQVIETPVVSITIEQIDDVPLIVAQLQKISVDWRVVPDPAKKSRIKESGRSLNTDRSASAVAYGDFGYVKEVEPKISRNIVVPY